VKGADDKWHWPPLGGEWSVASSGDLSTGDVLLFYEANYPDRNTFRKVAAKIVSRDTTPTLQCEFMMLRVVGSIGDGDPRLKQGDLIKRLDQGVTAAPGVYIRHGRP
jgi:hypothetical protein